MKEMQQAGRRRSLGPTRLALAVLGALLGWTTVVHGQLVPLGDPVLVNEWTASDQWEPRIDLAPDGRGVISWWGFTFGSGQDGDGYWVSARPLDAGGAPSGSEFVVNEFTEGGQSDSVSSVAADGSFVVVWSTRDQYDGSDVMVRRFASDGSPLTGEMLVNTSTAGSQSRATVEHTGDGGFVVVWSASTEDRIHGRVFDSTGTSPGPVFEVAPSYGYVPAVSVAGDGDFVVAWHEDDGNGLGIFARRFEASGTAVGAAFQVSETIVGDGQDADVAHGPGGGFVVAWTADGAPGDDPGRSIRARRFDADGSPLGGDLQVNSLTTGDQYRSHVAMTDHGDFLVVWEASVPLPASHRGDPTNESILGRLFRADGQPVGGDFAIAGPSTTGVSFPDVAAGPPGLFAVTWSSRADPADPDLGVLLRWFEDPSHIFSDDFESGATDRWN